jgi:hypothetical protein
MILQKIVDQFFEEYIRILLNGHFRHLLGRSMEKRKNMRDFFWCNGGECLTLSIEQSGHCLLAAARVVQDNINF